MSFKGFASIFALLLVLAGAVYFLFIQEQEPDFAKSVPLPEPMIIAPEPSEVIVSEPQPKSGSKPDNPDVLATVPLFFATNRKPADAGDVDEDKPTSKFTNELDDENLHFGTSLVTLPRDHRMGEFESPGWFQNLVFGENQEDHVFLQELNIWQKESMLEAVRAELDALDDRAVIAFVHGFNTSMRKAARRTGQLSYDLGFHGPTFFFSWPSQGGTRNYTHDSTIAEQTYPQMAEFLEILANQDADRVIVIAHSMGTRILSYGLQILIDEKPELAKKISTVILAAPDIDAVVFKRRLAPKFKALNRPVTVYVSSRDTALDASQVVNGFIRAGDADEGLDPIPNTEMIDASAVDSNFVNHTYFGDSSSIITDMILLLNEGSPASERATLTEQPGPTFKIEPPDAE